jgi:site-specific DNA-adenine methylase
MSCEQNKKVLGQFFTTNYKYILQNLYIPDDVKHIIEPFAGNCDLLSFIENKDNYQIECYDIDPRKQDVIQRDTLNDPPDFTDTFILTNPPYLARNKNASKELYMKYETNDLYKCFLKILIDKSRCKGGILIIRYLYTLAKTFD